MLVQDIMTRAVVAIGPDTPIGDVHTLMEQRNIRHFPILREEGGATDRNGQRGRLVGIVSDRDVRMVGSAYPGARPGVGFEHAVERIMSGDVVVAHPLDPIEEAARVLRERRIGAMPVLDGDTLVGIVTATDFLDALVRMTGVGAAATRLEVEVPSRPGALAGLLDRIASRNYAVSSVMTTRHDAQTTTFVIRVGAIDGHGLARSLRGAGYQVLWPLDKERLA